MTHMILVFILAMVSFTTVFFGGIHVWAQSLMIFSIFGITAAALWAWAINKAFKRDDQATKVNLDPGSISGILFLLWAGFQLIPLPEGILQFLSPSTKAAWETTGMTGGKGPVSHLSLSLCHPEQRDFRGRSPPLLLAGLLWPSPAKPGSCGHLRLAHPGDPGEPLRPVSGRDRFSLRPVVEK